MEELDDIFKDDLELENVDANADLGDLGDPNDIFGGSVAEIAPEGAKELVEGILKNLGIVDNKITILDEEDKEQEVDFFSLTREEQLDILSPNIEEQKPEPFELQSTEQDLIKYLRDNDLTIEEYLNLYKDQILEESGGSETVYSVDAYTDEELFLADLKSRFDDLTEEDLEKELSKALEDKELFTKKMSKLRADYKQLEETYNADLERVADEQREEQYNQFVDTMVDVAIKTPDLYGIELEDEEKNNVLSFLLELDDNGTSEFYKSLNDPETLYKAAWFLTYGKDAFDAIKNAYETEIANLKKDSTKKVIVKRDNKKIDNINDLF